MEGREGRAFTVQRAAEILGYTPRTVQRYLAKGWLCKPVGWVKMHKSAAVGEKSLIQFILFDHISDVFSRNYKGFIKRRKNFPRFLRQVAESNRFSSIEGKGEVVGALSPDEKALIASVSSAKENLSGLRAPTTEAKRCLHHEFVERHQFSFGWRARQLAPDNESLQDDLVQEMSLAVLLYDKPASREYLLEIAKNRAIDYLRYEKRRGRMPLIDAENVSDSAAEKVASLNTMIDALRKHGVPDKWMEQVLGYKLDAA